MIRFGQNESTMWRMRVMSDHSPVLHCAADGVAFRSPSMLSWNTWRAWHQYRGPWLDRYPKKFGLPMAVLVSLQAVKATHTSSPATSLCPSWSDAKFQIVLMVARLIQFECHFHYGYCCSIILPSVSSSTKFAEHRRDTNVKSLYRKI